MDAEEKLIALKKAYADIILNTSKEAAARVMSSEKRAVQYQHELKVAKEEALRMLLRLKQMMDFRNTEAEAAALNQQKKIEVLEAQLQEAEDIVEDLREKLGELQAEMEKIKKDNLQNVNEPNDANSREMAFELASRVHSYQPSKFLHPNSRDEFAIVSDESMPLSQQNKCSKCYHSKKVCMCGSYIRNRNLPSIILRNKEPGQYRNGCTQRIHACERDPLDKKLCLLRETDKLMGKTNCHEQEEEEDTTKAPSSGNKTLIGVESKLLADIKLSSFPPFHRKRKRDTRRRKNVTALIRKCTDLYQKTDQLPEPLTKHFPVSVKENTRSSDNISKIAPMLSPGKTVTQTHPGCADSSGGRLLQEDEGLSKKMVPLGEDTVFAEISQPPVCKVDVEKFDKLSNFIELNSSDISKGLPREPVRERVIKYTFQRRHKRGALNGSEQTELNAPPEPEAEKKAGDKKNTHKYLETSKSSLLVESSRDSRRLAQVARQLISLSEKKWWH